MKTKKRIFVAALLLLLCLTACGEKPVNTGLPAPEWPKAPEDGKSEISQSDESVLEEDVLYIGEKYFATQLNDIYWNAEDYMDKTIKYQGIYMSGTFLGEGDYIAEDGNIHRSNGDIVKKEELIDPVTGQIYEYVFRYTSGGCCGNDGFAGIELVSGCERPEEGDWVEITCTIDYFDIGTPYDIMRLNVSKFEALDERGAEFVPN